MGQVTSNFNLKIYIAIDIVNNIFDRISLETTRLPKTKRFGHDFTFKRILKNVLQKKALKISRVGEILSCKYHSNF